MRTGQEPFRKIANAIRGQIARRGLKPHTRLPSEHELSAQYRAARATVRRALAELQREGLIYTRQAAGSFVAEPRVDQDLDRLFSFTEVMALHHLRPASRLLFGGKERAAAENGALLAALQVKPGAHLVHLRRLRSGGGEPLVIADTWLPEARFPGFLDHDLERESVYEIMGAYGWRPTDAVQTFEAVALNAAQAALLEAAPGSPALLIRRIGYARGLPVEYAVDHYRGDRTRFRARLGLIEQRVSGIGGGDPLG